MSALDTQVGGDHYKRLKIQPTEYCFANDLNNEASNIVKYASRAGYKGDWDAYMQDLDKIIQTAKQWKELAIKWKAGQAVPDPEPKPSDYIPTASYPRIKESTKAALDASMCEECD